MNEQIFVSAQHTSITLLDQVIDFYARPCENHYEHIAYAVASSGNECQRENRLDNYRQGHSFSLDSASNDIFLSLID